MTLHDLIEQECYDDGFIIRKYDYIDDILEGTIVGNWILPSGRLSDTEANAVILHEKYHGVTCGVNLFEADKITQKKFEKIADDLTAERLFSLDTIIELHEYGARSIEDFAEAVDVSPKYICDAVSRYYDKYGPSVVHDGYRITFMPFNIYEESSNEKKA